MTQEDFYQIESSQRQYNEVMRRETERMNDGTIFYLNVIKSLDCKIDKDGDMYCCLLGENLQKGIAGFGITPMVAINEFIKEFGL